MSRISKKEREKFYIDALNISNKMYGETAFQEQTQLSNNMVKNIFKIGISWIAEVLAQICDQITITDLKDISNHMYFFVTVFNCMKKLLSLYIQNNRHEFNNSELLQTAISASFILSWKSLGLDDSVYCDINDGNNVDLSTMYYFCVGYCKRADLKRMEQEMFKLSGYKGCIDEHHRMILYLEGV